MRRFLTPCTLLVAAGLCLLSPDSRPLQAQSPETSPSVTGTWRGTFSSADLLIPAVLVIPQQERHRFAGMLWMGNSAYKVTGTVSASGNLIVIGQGELGILIGLLHLQGQQNGGMALEGRLRLQFRGGRGVDGQVQLLRDLRPE